jgi:hypothetical protein
MTHVFICKIKIIGSPFVVLTEEEAKKWVKVDPESHFYEKVPVETL